MIKREYTYFVAYQATAGDRVVGANKVITTDKIVIDDKSVETFLLIPIINNLMGFNASHVLITSISLLSSKWVWK